jgi:hypothetical protein
VKAIELEILTHREQEKRVEAKKRCLVAVAEMSRRRGREISWTLWGVEVLLLMWLFGDRCKAWGKKAVVEEVTQSFDDAVLVKVNLVAEKYKTIETEKELFMEKAHDQNWEFVRQEEKENNIVRLAEEEVEECQGS